LITNPAFQDAGTAPGLAAGWTLRSSCARESIAAFAPGDSFEGFERWVTWIGALGTAAVAPFAPNGTVEMFDAWPDALFAMSLSDGEVADVRRDDFETGWFVGSAAFDWSQVAATVGVLANGASIERFDDWPDGAVYVFTFPASALTRAVFADGPVELFATWTTKNTTLG
jgi:hypothetical protein